MQEDNTTHMPHEASPTLLTVSHRGRGVAFLALFCALGALGVSGWLWYDAQQAKDAQHVDWQQRVSTVEAVEREVRLTAETLRGQMQQFEQRVASVEQHMNRAASQYAALQSMHQTMTQSQEEWQLAELDHALTIAMQQLQLSSNVPAAIAALSLVESRLRREVNPRFMALRRAVNQDLEVLRGLPHIDAVGLVVRLERLLEHLEALPLQVEPTPPKQSSVTTEVTPPSETSDAWSWLVRFGHAVRDEFLQLVKVHHLDQQDVAILLPEQAYFLRQNIRLRLLDARLSALQRNQASFRSDLQLVRTYVERHFDVSQGAVREWLATLAELERAAVTVEMPDLQASLNAIEALRRAPEVLVPTESSAPAERDTAVTPPPDTAPKAEERTHIEQKEAA